MESKTLGEIIMAKKTFAAILTGIRESRGVSHTELADRTGLKPSAINHFEKGRRTPHIRNLVLLADALNTTTDILLGRSEVCLTRVVETTKKQ